MKSKLLTAFLLLCNLFLVECYECQFCKGNSCNEKEIPVTPCDEQPTDSLPYNFNVTFNGSMEVCLDLEYEEDKKVYPVKQCFRLLESYDICNEIGSSLSSTVKLKKCKVLPDMRDVKNDVLPYQLVDNAVPTSSPSHSSPAHIAESPTVHSTQSTIHATSPLATTHASLTTHPANVVSTTQATIPTTTTLTTHSTTRVPTQLTNEPVHGTTSAPTTTEKPKGHSNIAVASLFGTMISLIIQLWL